MIPREPWPMRDRCVCGSGLRWELRSTWRGRRFLGTCRNGACGRITTQPADGPERPEGLAEFLLDGRPVQPSTPPQVRLLLKHASLGWRHHHASCSCGSTLNFALRIDRHVDRPDDPAGVVLCLTCGMLTAEHWLMGEVIEVQALPEAWAEYSPVIDSVRRALAAREEPRTVDEDNWWKFG